MKFPFPAMTVYGKWIAISNPLYRDGCELLTADEFAEQSEHVTLRTAPNGKTFYRDEAALLVQFTGV
jgi:hypothetical protein